MSEGKHTPGPWKFVNHSWSDTSIYDAFGAHVALVSIEDDCTEDTQDEWEKIMEDRARLIAAAPDLLAALGVVLSSGYDGPLPDYARNAARAAIAKAKGES